MKPIFCGNFEYNARQSDLERLFGKYGKVDRVDMKSGFAFVYMDDERDAEDAIRGLDRREFGRQGRRLRVEWTKQERGTRRSASSRRSSANLKPTKTLFVINFDPIHTRTRDLERHFDPYGKISNIRIRRNFAFIQFESLEDATKALDATNMSKLMDRVISVEYAVRDDDERRNGHSPDRRGHGGRSPERNHDRSKSFSPYRRERGSPDYGHGPNTETRGHDRVRSPSPYQRERGSPDYGHGRNPDRRNRDRVRSPSPYQRERGSPDYGHGRNPDRRNHDRVRSPSPYQRERGSPDNGHDPNPERRSRDQVRSTSPYQQKGVSPDYGREPSPETRNHDCVKSLRSPSPQQEKGTPEYGRGPSPEARRHDRVKSPSPYQRERGSPDYQHEPSPDTMSDPRDSPVSEKFRSRSCSPLTQERS